MVRLVFGSGATRELPLAHVAGFLAFLATCGAFEYFLIPILGIAGRVGGSALRGQRGRLGAYGLFAFLALTMTPLELTTPDLLAAASVFAALGAMLRLSSHDRDSHWRRTAIVGGLALGVGALAKSFLVPWAFVCFVTLAVALGRRGAGRTTTVVVAWAVIALPWCIALSLRAGRPTFGDTGRLTYVWYVNGDDAPSAGGVPPGARMATTDAILPGVGVVGDAPGTDPMWLEPTRWNAILHARWSFRDEWETLKVFQIFYVQQFAPLLFLISLICVAPKGSRRRAWALGWVVVVPAAVGLGAYALVIVTARYIMPFIVALVLVVLATIPVPRRLHPTLAAVGLLIPIGLESLNAHTLVGLGLVVATIGALLAAVFVTTASRTIWVLSIVLAALVAHVVLTPLGQQGAALAAVAFVAGYWLLARKAIQGGRAVDFARRSEAAVALIVGLLIAVRFENRTRDDLTALARADSAGWGNVPMRIATELAAHGLAPGTRIAVIGPHAEAYWARAGRLHIVADVPRPLVERFWSLPTAAQDSLLEQFADAGATVAVASIPPHAGTFIDPRWQPVRFDGLVRRLTP